FKILVYNPKFGHSHSNFLGNIADILAEEGHAVTSLIPEIYPPFADGTTKSRVIRVPVNAWVERFFLDGMESDYSFIYQSGGWDKSAMIRQMPFLRDSLNGQCNHTLHYGNLTDRLKEEKFDVMITETFDYCGVGISHLISPRALITVSTTNIFDYLSYQIGQPVLPGTVPASFGGRLIPYSITSRLDNIIAMISSQWMFREMERPTERLFKEKYGEGFPDFTEIIANSTFTLTNSDPFLDFAKPTLRKIIEIGGIGVRDAKELDQEWDDLLSRRPRAVVVSFGTVARAFLMPIEMKRALAQAFARFPNTTFIWKYERPEEKDEFARGVENLELREWLPQNDLLADDRVQGFLTHAGKGSFFEAAARGKSCLLVPLFGDQFRNAATLDDVGFGHSMDKKDLMNAESIEKAVRTMLEDERIRQRAQEVMEMMESRPFTPRELLVKHVEFAARFGLQNALQPQSRDLSYIFYYNLDL
ncbi:hypothetical protein PFISCL1PPCAC_5282, partial [Pristionchus fissidentatus]